MDFSIILSVLTSLIALGFAAFFAYTVMQEPDGSKKMNEVASAIREGANAYLKRQYSTVAAFVVVLFLIIGFMVSWSVSLAFIVGAVLSALAGFIGMSVSVRANVKTSQAAEKSLQKALDVSTRGGAVTGITLVGLGLLGVTVFYVLFHNALVLIGFGFGASLISLFARVGGGIFTKAADVGADLVGKVEKGIPEDDPRNPAVIADNVGDNVGDCAGMAADLFESFVVTIIASMLLSISVVGLSGFQGENLLTTTPLIAASVGVLASIIGTFFFKLGGSKKIMNALYKGVIVSVILSLIGFGIVFGLTSTFYVLIIGVVLTLLIFFVTEYYTSKDFNPVKEIAKAAKTGAGTNLIQGLAEGMQSTAIPLILVVLAILLSFKIDGVYGISLAAVSMLSLTGIIITLDSYGPITDNAGGIAEMSGMKEKVLKITGELDAVGNTTKATTKGFAIASAALSALVLFNVFYQQSGLTSTQISLFSPAVIIGLFLGGLLPFLFSSFLMKAVGRSAFDIVEEVRRQFKTMKIMSGKEKPDYAKCVDISTKSALKELMIPGLIAVVSPIFVGFVFGLPTLAGMLAGAIVTGFLLAIFMATGGAAWDNAKKYIEDGNYGGKGSDAHKAAVVGDTVGDPFKDTAGPALNSLIKVLNTVTLIFIGVLITVSLNLI
jgi:K(+)-stimulated pyrophosphate-energized sodium pump